MRTAILLAALAAAAVLVTSWISKAEPKVTHAHTYQECLAKSYGENPRPCFVIDDGVLIERRDDPAT